MPCPCLAMMGQVGSCVAWLWSWAALGSHPGCPLTSGLIPTCSLTSQSPVLFFRLCWVFVAARAFLELQQAGVNL